MHHQHRWSTSPSPHAAPGAPQQQAQCSSGQADLPQDRSAGQQAQPSGAAAAEGQKLAKRRRAKKPPDAPRRPKSAYMFYLAEFRERYKVRRARFVQRARFACSQLCSHCMPDVQAPCSTVGTACMLGLHGLCCMERLWTCWGMARPCARRQGIADGSAVFALHAHPAGA